MFKYLSQQYRQESGPRILTAGTNGSWESHLTNGDPRVSSLAACRYLKGVVTFRTVLASVSHLGVARR